MLLAIDTGNTNTVFALYEGETRICDWRCKTVTGRTADEYAVWLERLFDHKSLSFEDVDAVIISSVVPDVNFDLRALSRKYFDYDALIIGADITDTGLNIRLNRPEELGADRIVNSVAAIAAYDLPAIILDFGTATTFDVINADGDYCGGAISPGVHLSIEALHNAAAQLPTISVTKPDSSVGKNTVQALKSGLYWGYVSMIQGMIQRLSSDMQFQRQPNVIATGGLAKTFAEDIPEIIHIDDNLTLDGLRLIYHRLHQTKAA